jgi:phosphoglycolate phosphatase
MGSVLAVLFDLDGTLLDTADGLAAALNRALAERQLGPLPAAEVRLLIGRGAPELVRRACAQLGLADAEAQAAVLQRFYLHYAEACRSGVEPPAYPGATESLGSLRSGRHRLGVVTNKQRQMSVDLLSRAGMLESFDVVVGGDSCARRKPDPEPLHFACERLGVTAPQTLMVGDSRNDVTAARAAGMRVVCVTYGYNEGHDPRTLGCDALIDSLAEVPALLAKL